MKRDISGGVECAKYGLLTLCLVLGLMAICDIGAAPRVLNGYLELGGFFLCLWFVHAIERERSPWVRPLHLPWRPASRREAEPLSRSDTQDDAQEQGSPKMANKDEVWPAPSAQEPQTNRLSTRIKGFLAGIAVNLLCCLVLIVAAQCLTAISPLSTFVLTYVPLIQGALIIMPVYWAANSKRAGERTTGLALGLWLGIVLQLGNFLIWYEHWMGVYAQ